MFLKYYCSVYIDWCTVSYYLHLFAYMCLCATLDGAQFEDPQGQDFEEFSKQQQFANEGMWSLIMFQS
jgi:hypothetical protein